MTAPQPFCELLQFNKQRKISSNERQLLEATVTSALIIELHARLKKKHEPRQMPTTTRNEGEDTMLDTQFLRVIILDILASGDYTLEGIARYTSAHEDLIQDVASGINTTLSLSLFYRLVELHKTTRPELYHQIRDNIIHRFTEEKNQQTSMASIKPTVEKSYAEKSKA